MCEDKSNNKPADAADGDCGLNVREGDEGSQKGRGPWKWYVTRPTKEKQIN